MSIWWSEFDMLIKFFNKKSYFDRHLTLVVFQCPNLMTNRWSFTVYEETPLCFHVSHNVTCFIRCIHGVFHIRIKFLSNFQLPNSGSRSQPSPVLLKVTQENRTPALPAATVMPGRRICGGINGTSAARLRNTYATSAGVTSNTNIIFSGIFRTFTPTRRWWVTKFFIFLHFITLNLH